MQNKKRWYRYFKTEATREEIEKTVAEGFDHVRDRKSPFSGAYTPPDSDAFVGRDFYLRCEERDYGFSFKGINEVVLSEKGEPDKTCYCNVKTLDNEVYFVNFLVPGYATSRQITLIADTKTGCGTVVDAHVGTEYTNIDVGRDFFFGRFDGEFEGGELHGYTTEMVGTAIEWSYGPDAITVQRHIYNSNLYYTYGTVTKSGASYGTVSKSVQLRRRASGRRAGDVPYGPQSDARRRLLLQRRARAPFQRLRRRHWQEGRSFHHFLIGFFRDTTS